MANILHVCGWFDPSGDITRSVSELNLYSKHRHDVIVRWFHPERDKFKFPEPEHQSPLLTKVKERMDWTDAVVYHLVGKGCEAGYKVEANKPTGFRNANVVWDSCTRKFTFNGPHFFSNPHLYKAVGSCHMGAKDFMGEDCAFLPALMPIFDTPYMPNWDDRPPCVAYTKCTKELDAELSKECPRIKRLNLAGNSWRSVMHMRSLEATVCIDAILNEGHYGLFGTESLAQGIPCVANLQSRTMDQILSLTYGNVDIPFRNADNIRDAVAIAESMSYGSTRNTHGEYCRLWMEQYYYSKKLVSQYWDPWLDKLFM